MAEQLTTETPEPQKAKKSHRKAWMVLGGFALVVLGYGIGTSGDPEATTVVPAAQPAPTVTVTAPAVPAKAGKPAPTVTVTVPGPTKTVTVEAKAKAPAEPKAPKAPPVGEPTSGQSNALDTAKDYLDYGAFSRKGLIDQLKFEEYSTADATWAVDRVGANWNEQAVKSAKDYLDYGSFSRGGLITQLEFEGFTSSQAAYGVNGAGL